MSLRYSEDLSPTQLRQIQCFAFRVISACFQKEVRTSHSMLFYQPSCSLFSLHVLEKHQVWPLNISAVSAATLRAGWEAPENIQCALQALIRGPKQILRPVLCLDPILTSSWHFLSDKSETQTSFSQWAHTQKKHINVKTLWKWWLEPQSCQEFEEHCMQRHNCPQRSKKENQEEKLLAETKLPLHKRERMIV